MLLHHLFIIKPQDYSGQGLDGLVVKFPVDQKNGQGFKSC